MILYSSFTSHALSLFANLCSLNLRIDPMRTMWPTLKPWCRQTFINILIDLKLLVFLSIYYRWVSLSNIFFPYFINSLEYSLWSKNTFAFLPKVNRNKVIKILQLIPEVCLQKMTLLVIRSLYYFNIRMLHYVLVNWFFF